MKAYVVGTWRGRQKLPEEADFPKLNWRDKTRRWDGRCKQTRMADHRRRKIEVRCVTCKADEPNK